MPAATDWATVESATQHVYGFASTPMERVRAQLIPTSGAPRLDLRVWFRAHDGEWHPTAKGLRLEEWLGKTIASPTYQAADDVRKRAALERVVTLLHKAGMAPAYAAATRRGEETARAPIGQRRSRWTCLPPMVGTAGPARPR